MSRCVVLKHNPASIRLVSNNYQGGGKKNNKAYPMDMGKSKSPSLILRKNDDALTIPPETRVLLPTSPPLTHN